MSIELAKLTAQSDIYKNKSQKLGTLSVSLNSGDIEIDFSAYKSIHL